MEGVTAPNWNITKAKPILHASDPSHIVFELQMQNTFSFATMG
jgi:hypothetical protein